MNIRSFNAGYKTLNTTIDAASTAAYVTVDAVRCLPNAFCDLGNMVRSDVNKVTGTVTSFFAGMRHATRVRSGKCRMLTADVRSNEE